MAPPPPRSPDRYNRSLPGVYGQFGAGLGVHAFYLQSALEPRQLDWVSLITDIRGSERWQVRDLFQRDVDNERITESLLPYLQDADKIKFFNPLTLTLLPMQNDQVLPTMPVIVQTSLDKDQRHWDVLERPGHHRVRWVQDEPHYGLLEWSDTHTKLVAIDGQHRLSALKRFWKDSASSSHPDFQTWRIPVVVVSFAVGADAETQPSVLQVVRSIFVYINTEAKQVNRARQILLSDESVNCVCTQELIQLAHENDLASANEREAARAPLLFYDWRGEDSDRQRVHAPAAVKSVEEIFHWFERYLLGDDFSPDQETALGVDAGHSLHGAFHHRKLSHADSAGVRARARESVLPALGWLLDNFRPYRAYIAALRQLEGDYESHSQSDLARHAFYDLRFGANLAPVANRPAVEQVFEDIKKQIENTKQRILHDPIHKKDLGMRGVVCAFGKLRESCGNPAWLPYAQWYTNATNALYDDGWLHLRPGAKRRDYLRHIAEDHNGEVCNYRLEHAEDALGAYVRLLVLAYGRPFPSEWRVDARPLKDELLDDLFRTVVRGFRKQLRPQLKPEFPEGGKPLTEEVNKRAERAADEQIRRFERELEQIERRRG